MDTVLHLPGSYRSGIQARRVPKKWVSLVFPKPCSVEPWRPLWAPRAPAEVRSLWQGPPRGRWRGPPHALLSSCFSFVAALAPPSRFLFGRPPALPSLPLFCPRVVVFPLAVLPAPLASFGMPGLCFWQESAAAVPMAGAVSRQLVGRRSRGACGTPETGQCWGACTVADGAGAFRLEAVMPA